MVNKIKQGNEIRDKVFQGNPHAQLALIRENIWALGVLTEVIPSSQEEKTKAQEIISDSLSVNTQIKEILNK